MLELELGDETVEAHRETGRYAAETRIHLVGAVGGHLAEQLALAASAAGVPDIVLVRANGTTVYASSTLHRGDVVLVKASEAVSSGLPPPLR